MDERRYTVEDVAKRFCVTTSAVRQWIRQGKLHAVRIGRPWIMSESDINEALIHSQRPLGSKGKQVYE